MIQPLIEQFKLHSRLFKNVLSGIQEKDAEKRLTDTINHIHFIAGHMLVSRLMLTGNESVKPDERFVSFTKTIDDGVAYPALEEIMNLWEKASVVIVKELEKMTSKDLTKEAPMKFPVEDTTMLGFLSFIIHHEAYHLGQLGLLRKIAGKEAMKYD